MDYLEDERLKLLDRKIEKAKKENALMKALYESDRILAFTDYGARASELNNRIASTFFKPLYVDQISRYENLKHRERKTEPNLSHLNHSKSRIEKQSTTPLRNFFGSNPIKSQQFLKPASFVEGSKNLLDISNRSRSRINTEVRGNSHISTKSGKSNKTKKGHNKSNKSVLSKKKKNDKSKSLDKSAVSKSKSKSKSKSRLTKKSNKSQSQERKKSKALTLANLNMKGENSKVSKKSQKQTTSQKQSKKKLELSAKPKSRKGSKLSLDKSKLSKKSKASKSKLGAKELSKSRQSVKSKTLSLLNSLDKTGKLNLLKKLQSGGKTGWPHSVLSHK